MTRYTLKSALGNNTSDVRLVQALMKQQDIYYGESDGVMTPYMANSLARFNKTGFAKEKIGGLHVLRPNGSTLTNLGKRATGDYADMKSLINLGEVISCKDEDWKLDILAAKDMPFPQYEGNINKVASALHKVLSDIWESDHLPFRLSADDFFKDDKGKPHLRIRFPAMKWLEKDCEFYSAIPISIINNIKAKLASIGFVAQEKEGTFLVKSDDIKFIEDRGEFEKIKSLLSDNDYKELAKAIGNILPYLRRAIRETESKSYKSQKALSKYFKSNSQQTQSSVIILLKMALDFLKTPHKSLFRAAGEVRIEVYNKVISDPNTVAFEYEGHIYVFSIRLAMRSKTSLEDTLLHESLHLFIEEKHQRTNGKDPAYAHESHFLSLPTLTALENPDSYTAFVREF